MLTQFVATLNQPPPEVPAGATIFAALNPGDRFNFFGQRYQKMAPSLAHDEQDNAHIFSQHYTHVVSPDA